MWWLEWGNFPSRVEPADQRELGAFVAARQGAPSLRTRMRWLPGMALPRVWDERWRNELGLDPGFGGDDRRTSFRARVRGLERWQLPPVGQEVEEREVARSLDPEIADRRLLPEVRHGNFPSPFERHEDVLCLDAMFPRHDGSGALRARVGRLERWDVPVEVYPADERELDALVTDLRTLE